MSTRNKTGVVLMTYGSATTAEGVREYFERIYQGKTSEETISEFERRYRLIGRSPLLEITEAQAAALETELGAESFVVRAGMRHSAPFIADAVAELKDARATSLIGVILAPQLAAFITDGYRVAFENAACEHGFSKYALAEPWPTEPAFVELLAARVRDAGSNAPAIFTTHSLPQRVVEHDALYLAQLQATIDAVRAQLPANLEWRAAYQSAGHAPERWLTPDLVDVLEELHEAGHETVLIAPIQFVADHLEVLYDLDIAAKAQCESLGLAYRRIALPDTDPLFIQALASVARRTTRATMAS